MQRQVHLEAAAQRHAHPIATHPTRWSERKRSMRQGLYTVIYGAPGRLSVSTSVEF